MVPHTPNIKEALGEVKKRVEDIEKTKTRKKIEDPRIKVTEKDGEKVFTCEECGNNFKTEGGAKQHMAKKHRPRSEDENEAEDNKKSKKGEENETSFNEIDLNVWDDGEDITQSQLPSLEEALKKYDKEETDTEEDEKVNENKSEEPVTEAKEDIEQKAKLESAMERIKYLEDENNEMKAKVESLEKSVDVKDDLIYQYRGKNEVLEIEVINKDSEISKYKRVFTKMNNEIKRLTDDVKQNENTESKAKIRKLAEQLRDKEKKVVDIEKKMLEMTVKVGEESNKKVEAENRMKSLEKNLENLSKIVEIERKNKEQQSSSNREQGEREQVRERQTRVVCRDLTKTGGCTYGSTCRFYHPEGVGRVEQVKVVDCIHWMEGNCNFTDAKCKYIHDPKKKDTKPKSNKKDFAEALAMVKEVRDAVAGGTNNLQAKKGTTNQQQMQPQMMMTNQQQALQPQMMIQPMNQMNQTMMNPMLNPMMMMNPMMMLQPNQQQAWSNQGQPTRQ